MIQRESPTSVARSHQSPQGPVRTCVGCRKRGLAVELLRVAAVHDGDGNHAVSIDSAGNLSGRGAWLHLNQQCLQVALRRRAFVRALRIAGSPDTSAVVEWFDGITQDRDSQHRDSQDYDVARQQNR